MKGKALGSIKEAKWDIYKQSWDILEYVNQLMSLASVYLFWNHNVINNYI